MQGFNLINLSLVGDWKAENGRMVIDAQYTAATRDNAEQIPRTGQAVFEMSEFKTLEKEAMSHGRTMASITTPFFMELYFPYVMAALAPICFVVSRKLMG